LDAPVREHYVRDRPVIPVLPKLHDRDHLVEGHGGHELPGPVSECLALLGDVDAVEPHLHGLAVSKHLDRIAVRDANDLA
jgi:hypothetical protein